MRLAQHETDPCDFCDAYKGTGTALVEGAFENGSNHSVVFRVGELVPRDRRPRRNGIAALLAADPKLVDEDVFQIGHHGEERDVLTVDQPEVALIQVGSSSRQTSHTAWSYGRPRQDAVALLENHVSGVIPSARKVRSRPASSPD